MRPVYWLVPTLLLAACGTGSSGSDGASRLGERFMQADEDGDGFISRAEAPSRIDFEAVDANGDSRLSLSEVENYAQGLRG